MKNQNTLEKSDKWIVGLTALCALMLFSWLVYDIAFLNPLLEGQIQIGKIYEAQNRVKRKFNRSLIWYDASPDETVYENDWIFTGSQSVAKIKLDSGGEIIVEPDSLIILSRKNGVLQLDLQHGRLMADVKTKDIKINVVRNGSLETVDTDRGVVSVTQKEDSATETEIEDINLDPDNDGENNISLSDLADQKYYEPEAGFSSMDENGFSFSEKTDFYAELLPGEKTTAKLQWQDPYQRWTAYEIQLSSDKNFATVVAGNQDEKEEFDFVSDKPGAYNWRIRGFDENGVPGDWTEPRPMNLHITWKQKAKPLEFERDNLHYQLSQNDLENLNPDRSHNLKNKKMKIQWREMSDANSYKVQLSDKRDFSNILEEKITKESHLDLENLQLGETYFRVVPETKEGVPIAEPSTGSVTTYFPPPLESSLKTVPGKNTQLLKWGKVPYAEAYEVRYKTDKNSDEEKVEYVEGNKLRVASDTGFLQWKVRVVDKETKKVLGENSKLVDWYDAAKRLASLHGTGQAGQLYPRIVKPEPRKTYISVNHSPLFIVMNWVYEKGAPFYEVEVSKNPNMAELVYSRRVDKKRAVINQKFTPGIYYMRVRAITSDVTQESWSETEVFRVINRRAR